MTDVNALYKQALNDPQAQAEIQRQAKEAISGQAAGLAAQAKSAFGGVAGALTHSLQDGGRTEQGPKSLRALAFIGGVCSAVVSFMCILNPFDIFMNPVEYIMSLFQLIFAATAMLMECPPEYVEKIQQVKDYEELMKKNCKFITLALGRGIFYCYIGLVWLYLGHFLGFLVGLYMIGVGGFHIGFGKN